MRSRIAAASSGPVFGDFAGVDAIADDSRYDTIVSVVALAELADLPRALSSVVRSLAPTGSFSFVEPTRKPGVTAALAAAINTATLFMAFLSQGFSFALLNTGGTAVRSTNKLLTTVAYRLKGETAYALEGSIFIAGAAVQWLRDGLGIIQSSDEVEALARQVDDNGGIYLVPAFVGLGAPHWDPYARGIIVGLTRGATKAHIARAALESIAYQTADIIHAVGGAVRRLQTGSINAYLYVIVVAVTVVLHVVSAVPPYVTATEVSVSPAGITTSIQWIGKPPCANVGPTRKMMSRSRITRMKTAMRGSHRLFLMSCDSSSRNGSAKWNTTRNSARYSQPWLVRVTMYGTSSTRLAA